MAHEALDKDLRGESAFLARFDRVYKAVNDAIDINGNDLAPLVRFAVQNGGQLSLNRIKQFIAKGHPQQPTNANSQLTVPGAMGTFVPWMAFAAPGQMCHQQPVNWNPTPISSWQAVRPAASRQLFGGRSRDLWSA